MESNDILLELKKLKFASLGYIILGILSYLANAEKYGIAVILPLIMAIALWFPGKASWSYLKVSLLAEVVYHGILLIILAIVFLNAIGLLYLALPFYPVLLIFKGFVSNPLKWWHAVCWVSMFGMSFYGRRYINRLKPYFVAEQTEREYKYRAGIIGVIVLIILFPNFQPREQFAVDSSIIGLNGDSRQILITPDRERIVALIVNNIQIRGIHEELNQFLPIENSSGHMDVSLDGNYLARTRERQQKTQDETDAGIELWNFKTGQRIDKFRGPSKIEESVDRVAFSPDSKRLITGSQAHGNNTVAGWLHIWDIDTGKLIRTIEVNNIYQERLNSKNERVIQKLNSIYALTYSQDGTRIAAGGRYGLLGIWDEGSGENLFSLQSGDESVFQLVFSPDGNYLAGVCMTAGDNKGVNLVRIWDTATGKLVNTVDLGLRALRSEVVIKYREDGKLYIAAGIREDKTSIFVWNEDGLLVKSWNSPWPNLIVDSITWSPDGNYVAISGNSRIKIWSVNE
ncbi:MAG: repeat-containing protein [Anaerospora sp.]|nr:repeat-containing protein [Anaerospora sp.]